MAHPTEIKTTLDDYPAFLKQRDRRGEPYILIGGQAANYWANRYVERAKELNGLYPFTSRDIDFFGTRADVTKVASAVGLKPHCSTIEAPDAIAGYMLPKIRGVETRVEFLHWVINLSEHEIRKGAIEAAWKGEKIRVISPIYLLQSKIANVAVLGLGGRQDAKHIEMLIPCVRCFLEDLIEQANKNKLTERGLITTLKHALGLSESDASDSAGRLTKIPWEKILPEFQLLGKFPKVQEFLTRTATKRYPKCVPPDYIPKNIQ